MSPDAGTNVVDVYVNYLRKKLGAVVGEGDTACPVIETVRGEGYQMSGVWQRMAPARVLVGFRWGCCAEGGGLRCIADASDGDDQRNRDGAA